MVRRFGVLRHRSLQVRFVLNCRSALATLAAVIALTPVQVEGAQVLIEPMTTGTYSWDWHGSPVNHSYGFDELAPVTVGAYQKGTITRNYRSFITFDTLQSQTSIISASLDLTVIERTINTLTNPFSRLEITLGLPTNYSAEEIANPISLFQSPNNDGPSIYDDLANNGFSTVVIPFDDVVQASQTGNVHLTVPLPISFVAAFNQMRAADRFLTVSFSGGDYGMYSADLSIQPRLIVNNLTVVPEPMSMVSLAIGAGALAIRRKVLAAQAA